MSKNEVSDKSLVGVDILQDLSEPTIAKLEDLCRWRHFRARQVLLDAGSPSKDVFFITAGRVNILNVSPSGKEVVYASLEAGQTFGELAAIDEEPRSASVVAAEASTVAMLDSNNFRKLVQDDGQVAFRLLQKLSNMIRSGDARIMELTSLAASQRVYAELLRMAKPDAAVPSLWIVRPLPPLREIASRVSTTRETVARAMGQVYDAELVKRKGRNLYIMDRAALENLARPSES